MFLFVAWMLVAAPRERAVLIYPRERVWFRRAFYNRHQHELQQELQRRYAVEVHDQVATEAALFAIDIRGAKLLVLSAHGGPYAMSFNGRGRVTVDASDQARLTEFFSQLAPDATIILQSCYTGLGFARTVKKGHDQDPVVFHFVQQPILEHEELANRRIVQLAHDAPALRQRRQAGPSAQDLFQHLNGRLS